MSSSEAAILSYAPAVEAIRYRWLLKFAIAMGAMPLGVGILTLLLFIPYRHEFFALLGLWTIIVGTCMVAAGFVALLVYRFCNWLKQQDLRRKLNREFTWTLLLLVVNFPAAGVCAVLGARLMDNKW
jgi:hypothetical protein